MELSPRLSVHYIDFHLSRSKSSMIVFHSPTKRGETWQLTFRISASSSNLLCFHRQDRTILAVPGLVTPPPSSHHPFTILQTVVVAVGQEGIFGDVMSQQSKQGVAQKDETSKSEESQDTKMKLGRRRARESLDCKNISHYMV